MAEAQSWTPNSEGKLPVGVVVTPRALAALANVPILDIRPRVERNSELGFIPGSVSVPAALLANPAYLAERYGGFSAVVLTCLSGRRSEDIVSQLSHSPPPRVLHLEGGVLAWQAAGYPVCGVKPVPDSELIPLERLEDFQRVVLSCFAAESVENQLSSGTEEVNDPRELVEAAFREARVAEPHSLESCLDSLAAAARRMGHPLATIASNVDLMRASLRQLA